MNINGVPQKLTLATRITLVRLLSIPVFILLVVYYASETREGERNEYLRCVATVLFVAAALTDALDGYLARVRHERTKLGAMLDPIADKALLLAGLVLLSIQWHDSRGELILQPHIPIWYALTVISRDVFLILGSVLIHFTVGHVEVKARYSGKASTLLQMVIIVWVLIGGPAHRSYFWLLMAATACTLISAAQYLKDGIRQIERAHAHPPPGAPPSAPRPAEPLP